MLVMAARPDIPAVDKMENISMLAHNHVSITNGAYVTKAKTMSLANIVVEHAMKARHAKQMYIIKVRNSFLFGK